MAKIRVYELARELNIDSKAVVAFLGDRGVTGKNHMSALNEDEARQVRARFASGPAKPRDKAGTAAASASGAGAASARPAAVAKSEERPSASASAPDAQRARKSATAAPQSGAAGQSGRAGSQPGRTQGGPAAQAAPTSARARATGAPGSAQSASTAPAAGTPATGTTGTTGMGSRPAPLADSTKRAAAVPRRGATPGTQAQDAAGSRAAGGGKPGARHDAGARPARSAGGPRAARADDGEALASTGRTGQAGGRAGSAKGTQASAKRSAGGGGSARPPAATAAGPRRKSTSARRRQARVVQEQNGTVRIEEPIERGPIEIPETITVKDFADRLGVPATSLIKNLMMAGVMASINTPIDHDAAAMVAEKLGFEVVAPEKVDRRLHTAESEPESKLQVRPPVVTIMGHVDHGKTTVLDAIRQTRVAQSEAGGITQHIGAYQVERNGRRITFIDTPGHEAFTAMRSRGAQVTDTAVLVVAADDGVMPQTVEALNHAKAADVPIIVAINKMDRAGANPDRVKQQLAEHDLVPEEWGGDTVMVPISALRKEGIDDLLEMILLVSELRDLKANPDRPAQGTVIEAELDKGRGPVATVLVQNGTLRVGDAVVAGAVSGKVRAMFDDLGRQVTEAGPSTPVAILGFSDVPEAGELFEVVEDERMARQMADARSLERKEEIQRAGRVRLSELYSKIKEGEVKNLNIVAKADVQGSVEALRGSVEKLGTDEVRINVIHGGVGAITESDVTLAATSGAIIIGFNVRPEPAARRLADREGVDIRLYRVIYEALDDVKAAMTGLLDPKFEEVVLGRAEVREVFRVPNVGNVAGCHVLEGKVTRTSQARVLRDHVVIHEGRLASLRRFKDDVREVNAGYECGMGLERFNDIKVGDVIECFEMQQVK